MNPSSKTPEVRLLLADDHQLIHSAVESIAERERIRVVHATTTWTAAVEAYPAVRPDVVLLDINIPPDDGGLEAARQITELDPAARVVAFSAGRDPGLISEAFDAGCLGFLSKNADMPEVPEVIRRAYRREQALDRASAASLIVALRRRLTARSELQLTDRDIEILRLMADGRSNMEIADQLALSRSTVANAISALFDKLGVADRTAAAITALRRGLIK